MPEILASEVGVRSSCIPAMSHIVNRDASAKFHSLWEDFGSSLRDNVAVDKNGGPNFLAAWRALRDLTQEELAEKVGTTPSMISMLEAGERGLSAKWLRRIAPILKTTPGNILDRDPASYGDVIDIWDAIAEREKPRALKVLESFKTGTDST